MEDDIDKKAQEEINFVCGEANKIAEELWGTEYLECRGNLEVKMQKIIIELLASWKGRSLMNPYTVLAKDIKVGDTYFVYYNRAMYEVLIGEGVKLDNMFVDIGGEKRIRVAVDELLSKVPSTWQGKVIKF